MKIKLTKKKYPEVPKPFVFVVVVVFVEKRKWKKNWQEKIN